MFSLSAGFDLGADQCVMYDEDVLKTTSLVCYVRFELVSDAAYLSFAQDEKQLRVLIAVPA